MQNENTNSNKDIQSSKKSFLSRKIDTITNQYFKFPKSAQKQHFKNSDDYNNQYLHFP